MDDSPRTSPVPVYRQLYTWLWYALFLTATVLGMMLLYSTLELERADREQASRTTQTLLTLRNLNRAVLSAETSQRGYLLTDDQRYFENFRAERSKAGPALVKVRALAELPNGPGKEALSTLEMLAMRKITEMDRTVEMARTGHRNAALELVRTNAGQNFMNAFRERFGEIERSEVQKLQRSANRSHAAEQRLPYLMAIVAILMTGALIGSAMQAMRSTRVQARLKYLVEVEAARERADLLARELNHRVKNIFTIVLSILRMTARECSDPADVAERAGDRILALSLAHEMWQGDKLVEVDLSALITRLLAPYHDEGERLGIEGSPVTLPGKDSTSVGLIFHELATNAVKYGAWSTPNGRVDIRWRCEDKRVLIDWHESGGPEIGDTRGQGFGSTMIDLSTRHLRGTFERKIAVDGLTAHLSFPADDCVIQPFAT